ncbi:hypothetical protein ACGFY3_27550 [Streptomyces mirabilis]|uniref:hypothetical protein n=1 Tax=Streptomyces mirabilis TaxID=68239 RepID=UPI003715E7EE
MTRKYGRAFGALLMALFVGTLAYLYAADRAAAASVTPSPKSSSAAPGVTVVVPPPASKTPGPGFKDFLIPLGTVLGAAAGVSGAVWAASVSARSQERRSVAELEFKRVEAEKLQAIRRADDLIEHAGRVFDAVAEIGSVSATAWSGEPGTLLRRSTRLTLAKVLASAELLGDETLKEKVDQYLGQASGMLDMATPVLISQRFDAFAEVYQQLLQRVHAWQKDLLAK